MNSIFLIWCIGVSLCSVNLVKSKEIYTYCEQSIYTKLYDVSVYNPFNIHMCTISNLIANSDDNVILVRRSSPIMLEAVFHGSKDKFNIYVKNFVKDNFYTNVKSLIVENSSMTNVPSEIFKEIINAESVTISNVGIEKINANDFENTSKLRKLMMNYNQIVELPSFMLLNCAQIESVDFSHNKIQKIEPNTFSGAHTIKYLKFSFNQLSKLDKDIFINLNKLEIISLDHNQLEFLNNDLFRNIDKSLESLDLSFNNFKIIDCQLLKPLRNFDMELNLSGNDVANFDSNCYYDRIFGKISKFYYYNSIKNIIYFTTLFDFKELNLTNTKITEMIISDNIKFATKKLWIQSTSINNLANFLNHFDELEFLDLSNSEFDNLPSTIFNNLGKIKQLLLRNCSLTSLPYGIFKNQRLDILDLSNNHFKEFNLNMYLPSLQDLKEIYLDGNDISRIDGLSKNILGKLNKIGISNNEKLKCSFVIDIKKEFNDISMTSNKTNVPNVYGNACDEN